MILLWLSSVGKYVKGGFALSCKYRSEDLVWSTSSLAAFVLSVTVAAFLWKRKLKDDLFWEY